MTKTMEPHYFKSDIAKLTGLSLRTIQLYVDMGLVVPYIKGKKRGSNHKYSLKNLKEFRAIIDLKELGLSLAEIKAVKGERVAWVARERRKLDEVLIVLGDL